MPGTSPPTPCEHGPLPQPAIALLVSGGHTQLLRVDDLADSITEIGTTVDDAAGEAYDKVARLLGLSYPGGPVIDRLAADGDPAAVRFPRGLTGPRDPAYDFSFSGLKTAVARYVESAERDGRPVDVPDVCASFQEAVVDVLTAKTVRAAVDQGIGTVVVAGGVAANGRLRALAAERCTAAGLTLRVPRPGPVHGQRRHDRRGRRACPGGRRCRLRALPHRRPGAAGVDGPRA